MSRAKKMAQYDELSDELIYSVGFSGSGENTIAGDLDASRKPKNEAEGKCFDLLRRNGWKVTKRGWPDFFCVRGGEVCAVEVKPSKSCALKKNQLVIMGLLSAKGIRCFLWSPDGGFEEVMGLKR